MTEQLQYSHLIGTYCMSDMHKKLFMKDPQLSLLMDQVSLSLVYRRSL